MKDEIQVSPEMMTFIGLGKIPADRLPEDPVVFYFDCFDDGTSPILGYRRRASVEGLETVPLVLVVKQQACRRIFDYEPDGATCWHLSSALRSLALSLIDCEAQGEARTTLRLARSIELLCQIHAALKHGELIPSSGDGSLSELDVARIANARRIVDERWNHKLTIAEIAQMAGINRDKLVRGFRDLYNATVADVLSERRLIEARKMLLTTDLPVASVGYRCSYLNNASFTRAFARRFGVAPTEMRRIGVAA